MSKGTLFILSAPSGGGKSSLVRALLEKVAGLQVSISYTTRPMRPSEVDGVNYFFVSPEAFNEQAQRGDFLEHAKVFDYDYGTSRDWVMSHLERGEDIILEIDWQGAQQIRHMMPEAVSIYILPPSKPELLQRLQGRGEDSEAVIAGRMAKATNEMSHCQEYDYIVINDKFDQAVDELAAILVSRRLRTDRQAQRHQALIAELQA